MIAAVIRIGVAIVALASMYYAYRNSSLREPRENLSTRNNISFDVNSITTCAICLGSMNSFSKDELLSLPCKHKYHKKCILEIFKYEVPYGRLCPSCRSVIGEDFIRKVSAC